MNMQTQLHELQAGEVLALPASCTGRFILVEGEVLFQPPAAYLAGTVVLPPAARLAAPASLPLSQLGSLRATRRARIVVAPAPNLFAFGAAMVRAATQRLPRWLSRRPWRSSGGLAS